MHLTNSFRFLWISQLFANIGGVFYIVGLIPLIHAVTGSAAAMALVPFLTMVSRFVSAMIAPLLLERMHLQPLLALSQFGKTFVLLLLACFSTMRRPFLRSFYLQSLSDFLMVGHHLHGPR
ncbi:hypothetical protein [Shouchella clausii]|uniref:hypothetical protein n=1 Tax=Shouchella clausii TaxID=79880 RepID=UPI00214898AA|nr:hypothetical protein [Shouchella clausii]MCR1287057.1 hypothetical protein [Shouchella clausii]MEB5471484.1 hypothetical protein [Shouchella clausii]WQG94883.1 hypothetical protein SR921_20430 [Shouchella clausii]